MAQAIIPRQLFETEFGLHGSSLTAPGSFEGV